MVNSLNHEKRHNDDDRHAINYGGGGGSETCACAGAGTSRDAPIHLLRSLVMTLNP